MLPRTGRTIPAAALRLSPAIIAANVADQVGLSSQNMLTDTDLRQMSNAALWRRATNTQVFAEVEPNQKERIILALQKAGHVVGYLGDGINDIRSRASALTRAKTSSSSHACH
jgi:Mg2+-importing ATPase